MADIVDQCTIPLSMMSANGEWNSADHQCQLRIHMHGFGFPTNARWYDFFAAGIAVENRCVAVGSEGFAVLGEHRIPVGEASKMHWQSDMDI